MATWEDLDVDSNVEEEAIFALMATTSTHSNFDFENDDGVFYELTSEELITAIKDLVSNLHSKSRRFKISQQQNKILLEKAKAQDE